MVGLAVVGGDAAVGLGGVDGECNGVDFEQ